MSGRLSGRRFDADHDVVTEAMLFLGDLDAEYIGEAAAHATHYEPVPIDDFADLIARVPDDVIRRSTFVDLGSGLGRAVFLAMRLPFKRIVGIEISAALNETAKENLEKLRGLDAQCTDVRFANEDARTFAYPPGDLVVFLFNPFDADALRATLVRIAARADAGETRLIYHTPEHRTVPPVFGFVESAGAGSAVLYEKEPASSIADVTTK